MKAVRLDSFTPNLATTVQFLVYAPPPSNGAQLTNELRDVAAEASQEEETLSCMRQDLDTLLDSR